VQYHVIQRDEKQQSWIAFKGADGTILRIEREGGLPKNDILGKSWAELGIRTEVMINIFELPEK
jgi:hypothetical protein